MSSKNIIFHVTKQYMKRNRRRTAITFIGIVFMVILMTCVFAGKETAMRYLRDVAVLDKGSWHLIFYDLKPEEAEQVAAMDTVKVLGKSVPFGCMEFLQSGNPENKPMLDIKAYSAESFAMMNITLAEGRLPQNGHELIVSKTVTADGSPLKPGDRISGACFDRTVTCFKEGETIFPAFDLVFKNGETKQVPTGFPVFTESDDFQEKHIPNGFEGDFSVVGLMEVPFFERSSSACYPALTLLGDEVPCNVNTILQIQPDKISSVYDFAEGIRTLTGREINFDTNELLLSVCEKGTSNTLNSLAVYVEVFFTVLIMAASVLLIYNVLNMSFAERARYLGMLSSVGATGRQKRQSVYYESFVLLIPALPLGILSGLGLIVAAMHLLKPQFDRFLSMGELCLSANVPVTLTLGLPELGIIIALSIVTVLVSVLIPAVRISRIQPVESIRGNTENAKKKHFRTRKNLLAAGKPERLLAVSSVTRTKALTRSVIRSIAVFTVLTMVTLYGAQSVITVMKAKTEETGWDYVPEGYDYYFLCSDEDEEIYSTVSELLANDSSVTAVKTLDSVYTSIERKYISDAFLNAYKTIWLQFDNHKEAEWEDSKINQYLDDVFCTFLVADDADFQAIAAKSDADMRIAGDPDTPAVLVYNNMHLSTDYYQLGETLNDYKFVEIENILNTPKGGALEISGHIPGTKETASVPVINAGFADSKSVKGIFEIIAGMPNIIINRCAYEKLTASGIETLGERYLFFAADPEQDTGLIRQLNGIVDEAKEAEHYSVAFGDYANRNMAKSVQQIITAIIRILAYCFTALVSVVCLLNLYNSIRGRAAERSKETAILRSVGITEKQLNKMHDIESLMLLIRGYLIAAVFCAGMIAVLHHFMTGFFGTIRLPVPWLLSAGIAVFIGAAVFVITRLCSRSTDSAAIIEEIRRETV